MSEPPQHRWMRSLAFFGLAAGVCGWPWMDGSAVQFETQAEKEANLQQQARGGLFNQWTFDKPKGSEPLAGFVPLNVGEGPEATWQIQSDPSAPSPPNAVFATSSCSDEHCYRLLIAQGLDYEYPDLTVRLRALSDHERTIGGAVFGLRDGKNFYAVVVDVNRKTIEIVRVLDGTEQILVQGPAKPKAVAWHTLRVQRNTIISKDVIEVFFDGQLTLSVQDQALGLGRVGLLMRGKTSLHFDSFHAIPLFSQRPFSPPAAY